MVKVQPRFLKKGVRMAGGLITLGDNDMRKANVAVGDDLDVFPDPLNSQLILKKRMNGKKHD